MAARIDPGSPRLTPVLAPKLASMLIDGVPATADDLAYFASVNYGGFTLMTVQDGAVRGLDLHLARLRETAVTLFGEAVSEDRLRDRMRQAVSGRPGPVSLRVTLFCAAITVRDPSAVGPPRVMTTVGEAAPVPATPVRLTALAYRREMPALKHVATFGLIQARRRAMAAGFDDALFHDDGVVSEGSIWNIGFRQGETVVWPEAPMLAGTTQGLLQRGLDAMGIATETRVVRLEDLAQFDGAFLCNASTPARPVASIGDLVFARPTNIEDLHAAWATNAAQTI